MRNITSAMGKAKSLSLHQALCSGRMEPPSLLSDLQPSSIYLAVLGVVTIMAVMKQATQNGEKDEVIVKCLCGESQYVIVSPAFDDEFTITLSREYPESLWRRLLQILSRKELEAPTEVLLDTNNLKKLIAEMQALIEMPRNPKK